MEETGILELEDVDVVEFDRDLIYDENKAENMKLISNSSMAWREKRGCWIRLKPWIGHFGRSAMLVEWHDNVAYRLARNAIDKGEWTMAGPTSKKIRLG